MVIPIEEIKPGMKLNRAIVLGGRTLLGAGATLSLSNIEALKKLRIVQLDILDRYSVYISPEDKMTEQLIKDFTAILRETCPRQPEANMNDTVVYVADELEGIISDIAQDEELLYLLMESKITNNKWLYECSIYTAVLSGILAGCMEMSPLDIKFCVLGALLHDIGMAEMPHVIGDTDPSGQNLALFKEHTVYGYYFAIQKKFNHVVAECIQSHHERWDGSGFPNGMKGREIPIYARIVGMCAEYAEKVVCRGIRPYMAFEEIYGTSGIYYDSDVVDAFTENIPVYPLGALVRLSTREVGIVVNVRKNRGPRPVVKVYYNRVNRAVTDDRIVDLGQERTVFIEEIL